MMAALDKKNLAVAFGHPRRTSNETQTSVVEDVWIEHRSPWYSALHFDSGFRHKPATDLYLARASTSTNARA